MSQVVVTPELFPFDAGDPVARFLRDRLRGDWPHLLIFSFLIYGPVEKLILPAIGGYLVLGPDVRMWRPDLESMLTGFVWFPFFFAFYLWSGSDIANVFRRLSQNGSLANRDRYAQFTQTVYTVMSRWWWWVLGFVIAVGLVLLAHFELWKKGANPPPWFGDLLLPRVVSLVLVGCVGYVVSQILIREWLALVWWRRMWRDLKGDLVLHPFHPDEACGLGAFGRHAIGISHLLLVMTLFVFMGSVLPSLRPPPTAYSGMDTVVVTTAVLPARTPGALRYVRRCVPPARCPPTAWSLGTVVANGNALLLTVAVDSAKDSVAHKLATMTRRDMLRVRVTRLPSQVVALDTGVVMDSMNRAALSLVVPNRLASEKFEVRVVGLRSGVVLDVPTVSMWGVTLYVWTPLIAVEWALLLVVTLASLGFVVWPTHEAMEDARDAQLGGISQDIEELLTSARGALKKDPSQVPSALEGIERAKQVRAVFLEECDTWPISRSLRGHLKISSAVPVASSLFQLLATGFVSLLRGTT